MKGNQTPQQEQPQKKIERIALSLNKSGLSYLTHGQFKQALQYFKKAERIIQEQLKILNQDQNQNSSPNTQLLAQNSARANSQSNKYMQNLKQKGKTIAKISKLAAITYNNLACYYKKTNKPKVALGYLKKALFIEVQKVKDWTSTASTHLNICAIYSYLQSHQQAADHALLAISMLQKNAELANIGQINEQKSQKSKSNKSIQQAQQVKSYWNIYMLSHYNLAIQYQYLKRYEQSLQSYRKALELGKKGGKKNTAIIVASQQAISRVQNQSKNQKKRLIQILQKKRQNEQKGNYQFMRKNKRNIHKPQQQQTFQVKYKKYSIYKHATQNQKNNYTSVGKLDKKPKLDPISNTSSQNMHIKTSH